MPKLPTVRKPKTVFAQLESADADAVPFRQLFDSLGHTVTFELAVVVTSLPRGSLQLVQPPRLASSFAKGYGKSLHTHDRPAWESILRQQPVKGADCWPGESFEESTYFTELMRPNLLRYVLAAPLAAPVLEGYAGAIELFRTEEQGPFDSDDVRAIRDFTAELDRAITRARERRQHGDQPVERPLRHHLPVGQFIFDANLNPLLGKRYFAALDTALRENILELANQRLGKANGTEHSTDRVSLADSHGDLWNFRVVVHGRYPALGEGHYVFFCQQPDCHNWGLLRSSDFSADPELSRLIPAIRFMQEEYARGPTLHEIARIVHLSPFHFHRRFTELLGITPKHFLLDCQIEEAKARLAARDMELSEIATACGFAHQSHFTSRFKQATGLTPTRWRRLALETRP